MPGEKPGPLPEEREEIEKERVLETARLIEGGAKFKVKEGKEPYFEVLRKQKLAAEEGYIRSLDPEERATKASEINEKTKAYLGHGKLEPGIFNKIAEYDIEYIYRQFPEGKIDRFRLVIGGKTVKRLKEELIDEEVGLGFGLPVTTLKNKEKIDNRNKKYMNEHKKEFLEYRKIYDAINKDKLLTYGRAWYHSQDKENYNKKKREWDKNKKYTDLNYALKKRLRLRVLQAFNKFSTTGKIRTSNDYNINYKSILEHLIKTLPADFHDKDYVIDHILPCCSFDLTNSEEVIKCFAPDNHQWLTREENAKKVSSDLKQRRIKLI